MILSTTEDLRKYISVASNFQFASIEPYITKAINSYTKKYVGKLHVFLENQATGSGADIKNEAREHLRSAIANFAMFLFSPYNSVLIDSSGMSNIQNEQRKNIEWWQKNDISRELLRSGHESMDFLLAILETNPTIFTEWTTDFGALNKELLVNNTKTFQKAYNIFESRQTFLALVPSLRQVEDQYIKTFLCSEVIQAMKTDSASAKLLELKEYCQKAIVSFTIAKVYDEGIFLLDAYGIKLKFDTLPNETVRNVDYGKPADQLQRAVKKNLDNGTNYMKMAKQLIIDNPTDFTQCANPLLHATPTAFTVYNTKGVVGI